MGAPRATGRYNDDRDAQRFGRLKVLLLTRALGATLLSLFLLALVGCQHAGAPRPTGDPLPSSMKGYELYTWDDGTETWFTLLPGTNRLKTPNEVFSDEREVIDTAGWFAVTVAGLDAIGGQLSRLPEGASVFLSTVRYPPGAALERLPTPESVLEVVRNQAIALGLDLQVIQ